MEKQISNFIFRLKYFQHKDVQNIDDALDFLFNTVDDKLLSGDFIFCNKLLNTINVKDFNTNILVGMLTITAQWKEKLTSRPDFFKRVKVKLETEFAKNEIEEILYNLD